MGLQKPIEVSLKFPQRGQASTSTWNSSRSSSAHRRRRARSAGHSPAGQGEAAPAAGRGYVLETGRVQLEDQGSRLLQNEDVKRAYLGG